MVEAYYVLRSCLWLLRLSDLSGLRCSFVGVEAGRYQAVILNLTTGQSNEMRLYDPDLPFFGV